MLIHARKDQGLGHESFYAFFERFGTPLKRSGLPVEISRLKLSDVPICFVSGFAV